MKSYGEYETGYYRESLLIWVYSAFITTTETEVRTKIMEMWSLFMYSPFVKKEVAVSLGTVELIAKYRVSIKSFPNYKHLLQAPLRCIFVRRVSAVDNFPTSWRTSTLGFTCSSVFGCNISKQVDWERWSDTLATTIAGYHPPWLLFMGVCWGQSVFDTSSRYYKFEGKNNRHFCYNNWRHVGEHVGRNLLSIRRSPCNKRSTCWSVLMCCKKTFWVTFWKKKYVCIPCTVIFL